MKIRSLLVGAAIMGATSYAHAGPVYSTWQHLGGCNTYNSMGTCPNMDSTYDYQSGGAAASSSLTSSRTINGTGINDTAESMTVEYDGTSYAGPGGVLKAGATASVTNGFYAPEQNIPFANEDFSTNPDGVPESIFFSSNARYQDSFTVSGASDLAFISLSFHIDGTLSGTEEFRGAQINFMQFSPFENLFVASNSWEPTFIDEVISSILIPVIDGVATVTLELSANINFDWLDAAAFQSGLSDFMQTVTITGISGFNAAGQAVDLVSASDSSGYNFSVTRVQTTTPPPVSHVPEPSVLALMGFGLVASAFYRRKTKAQHARV